MARNRRRIGAHRVSPGGIMGAEGGEDMPFYNNPAAYQPVNMYGGFAGPQFGQPGQPGQPMGQRYEIIHVNGENGARALQMAPNSNALVMDDTAPLIWLCQTDGAGYKTVQAFDIAPHRAAPAVDVGSLEARIARLEEIVNGSKSADAVPRAETREDR